VRKTKKNLLVHLVVQILRVDPIPQLDPVEKWYIDYFNYLTNVL